MRQAIQRVLHTAGDDAMWYESAEAVVDVDAAMTKSMAVTKGGDAESGSSRIGGQVWFAWNRLVRGCRGFARSGQAAIAVCFAMINEEVR
jgi:hypothetical protein